MTEVLILQLFSQIGPCKSCKMITEVRASQFQVLTVSINVYHFEIHELICIILSLRLLDGEISVCCVDLFALTDKLGLEVERTKCALVFK